MQVISEIFSFCNILFFTPNFYLQTISMMFHKNSELTRQLFAFVPLRKDSNKYTIKFLINNQIPSFSLINLTIISSYF